LEYKLLLSVRSFGKFLLLLSLVSTIVGCSPLTKKAKSTTSTANLSLDEKPEILDISASVIWDGEQTLGGNWISHPNVDSPERVVIKNISNGKSIVGAIFKQTKKMETENAVLSSDAAKALGISKNNQTKVQIIAVKLAEGTSPTPKIASSGKANNAVIETKLSEPFIQVGIFGVQNNANKTKERMVQLNLPVTVFDFQIKGKPYWRVVAGPANTSDSRKNMLKLIRSAGFKDAYFVSN
tara:strand:- start:265 stop:981 length:717 start_codon:yes stop_codon:yes gene_type:complete